MGRMEKIKAWLEQDGVEDVLVFFLWVLFATTPLLILRLSGPAWLAVASMFLWFVMMPVVLEIRERIIGK